MGLGRLVKPAVAGALQPPMRASEVVVSFLRALEARDLPAATALLAPGAQLKFPGSQPPFASLEDVVAWSRDRYRFVRKRIERFDEIEARRDDGAVTRVVYCLGTLSGEWPGGGPFEGVRFVDRFELDGAGRITDQQVWNDLGEVARG
jgi:hypothetical protein